MPGWQTRAFVGIILLTLLAPVSYQIWRTRNYRNFRVVEDGVLYRSGQLSLKGLKRIVHDYGIKTVVTLRYADDPSEPGPDHEEEKWCNLRGVHHVRLRQKNFVAEVGSVRPPQDENIKIFLDTMADKTKHPVLVHCYAGKNRTGAMCAIYRMEYDGWSAEKAIDEMKAFGYGNIAEHQDLLQYLLNYERKGYAANRRMESLMSRSEVHGFSSRLDVRKVLTEWRRGGSVPFTFPPGTTPVTVHGGVGTAP